MLSESESEDSWSSTISSGSEKNAGKPLPKNAKNKNLQGDLSLERSNSTSLEWIFQCERFKNLKIHKNQLTMKVRKSILYELREAVKNGWDGFKNRSMKDIGILRNHGFIIMKMHPLL